MVDAEELREGSTVGIVRLGSEDGISQAFVILIHNLLEKRLVKAMCRLIETQAGRREGRDDPFLLRLEKALPTESCGTGSGSIRSGSSS